MSSESASAPCGWTPRGCAATTERWLGLCVAGKPVGRSSSGMVQAGGISRGQSWVSPPGACAGRMASGCVLACGPLATVQQIGPHGVGLSRHEPCTRPLTIVASWSNAIWPCSSPPLCAPGGGFGMSACKRGTGSLLLRPGLQRCPPREWRGSGMPELQAQHAFCLTLVCLRRFLPQAIFQPWTR